MADIKEPVRDSIGMGATDFTLPSIAYFSMEIAVDPAMPTYSGGLGMLAGDTLRAAADMGAPMVAVTLLHRKGYFRQHLSADGVQTEEDEPWNPESILERLEPVVAITVQNRPVLVRAWRHVIRGVDGYGVPVIFLDTDVDPNDSWDRQLTDHLYGGDTYYRLCQEAVLGIGGIRMLTALGYQFAVHHMNEGHAALLTMGLLEDLTNGRELSSATEEDINSVRQRCVFTTHTPVPAGHDRFSIEQTQQVLGYEMTEALQKFGCCPEGMLNMTYVALRFSRYVNGVAMQHGKVSQKMFPDYSVNAITNGVHAATWIAEPVQKLLDEKIPAWRHDNLYLRFAIGIDARDIEQRHRESKRTLLAAVQQQTGVALEEHRFTVGFARRAASYKRAELLFWDAKRLVRIAEESGGLQILYGGKAHPHDEPGKAIIHRVFEAAGRLHSDALKIVYLENYEWELGRLLTNGVDLWLNTPRRPYEASGTSGMKAAMNGVPSLSTLDGWWIEGCIEGATGWAIAESDEEELEAESLYEKLEAEILPLFYNYPDKWNEIMRITLAINGSFFNTQRMLSQYLRNAYFPGNASGQRVDQPEMVLVR
ncbi:MAG TPA: alpha-glucan family phosphorylase [Acidobacteriaceae bacterium]|jgi:starch phosphorylase|nr:alpha-glucan family phosphorylase [Acidobacteriaceae bacterium]